MEKEKEKIFYTVTIKETEDNPLENLSEGTLTDQEVVEALRRVYYNMNEDSKSLDPEISKALNEDFWSISEGEVEDE